MIRRIGKNLGVRSTRVPAASAQLEADGYAVLRGVFTANQVARMRREIDEVFRTTEPERNRTDAPEFRYEMLNRSAAAQAAVANRRILSVVEPLLGDDCHVIANTAWRNPPDFAGGPWHCDAGPHVPRPEGVEWDDRIPYPVFAIGAHILLKACRAADGPTMVVPGSHRSGRLPPFERIGDPDLTADGRPPALLTGAAGDVALFVSDAWHAGRAARPSGRGRLFLQVHYGRRDIAQRLRPTAGVNHLSDEAVARAGTDRKRTLVGLHAPFFYDG
jgi:ectoine hydroxylase-related dioxygenase (phytanoyl-CoA dioxygenase family)